jgi:uncharacterized membrane protein YkvA (DUF1232 family)
MRDMGWRRGRYNTSMARRRNISHQVNSIVGLFNLHQTGRLFWALYWDRRVPLLLKIYAASGLVYFFSPMDNVPHKFTGIDLLDDAIVGLVIIQTFVEMAPPSVVDEHCERLGLDPEKVFFNVPQVVQLALETYLRFDGGSKGGLRPGLGWWVPPPGAYPPPGDYPPPPTPPGPPPTYTRYSAYERQAGE